MKFVENTNFNNYVESYKKLPLKTKKEILKDDIVRIGDARIRLLLLQGAETIVN